METLESVLALDKLPEYVPVTQLFDFYRILTEANEKNRQIETNLSEEELTFENIKNNVVLIQFKLVENY